jgi:hypothetical protein
VAGVTLCVPDVDSVPLHAPLAVHAVALVLDQVSVAADPAAMLVGLTVILTAGAGVAPAETLNTMDAVAELACVLPAKLAVNAVAPACDGVMEQEAIPVALVVAVQDVLPKVNVTVCPATPAIGSAEISNNEATTLTG